MGALFQARARAEPILAVSVKPEIGAHPVFVATDFREINGQEHVKRALEVTAAGGHNVLLTCAPSEGVQSATAMPKRLVPALSDKP